VCVFNFTFCLVSRHVFYDVLFKVAVVYTHRTVREVSFLERDTDSTIRAVLMRRIEKVLCLRHSSAFSDLMFLHLPLSAAGNVENALLIFKPFQHWHEC